MLTDMKTLLDIAEEKGCAIPAFNVYNAETALGAIFAAEEANSCVILRCTAVCSPILRPSSWLPPFWKRPAMPR